MSYELFTIHHPLIQSPEKRNGNLKLTGHDLFEIKSQLLR